MASIQKIEEGKYRVFFCVKRKRKTKTIYAKNDKQALKQANILEGKMEQTGSLEGVTSEERQNKYMIDVCEEYMYYLQFAKENPIKQKTTQKYSDIIKYQIGPFFKDYKVSAVGVAEVDDFMVWMRSPEARKNKTNKRSYSQGTIKDVFTLLKCILKYAVRLGYTDRNPCDNVDTPKVKNMEAEYYDDEALEKMLSAMDKEVETAQAEADIKRARGTIQEYTIQKDYIGVLSKQIIIYLAVNTAARRGEILGLCRSDINTDKRSIRFCRQVLYAREVGTYLEDSLKGGKDKTVFISSQLLQMIENYILELDKLIDLSNGKIPKTDMLFMSLRNTQHEQVGGLPFPDPISEWFKLFLKRNGLPPITFHKLRHSSLSYMLNNGVDPLVVMKIAGHSSLEQIQKRYGHAWDSSKIEAADKFEELFAE